jgi:hypothetical protein
VEYSAEEEIILNDATYVPRVHLPAMSGIAPTSRKP